MTTKLTIDSFNGNLIAGWAYDSDFPSESIKLMVTLNKKKYLMTACEYRVDLRDAGIGDGNHGFKIIFDQDIDVNNENISIKAINGETLFIHNGITKTNKYCDVTDLFHFLSFHGHPSGIQKLQLNIIYENSYIKNSRSIIFLIKNSSDFYEVPNTMIEQLINSASQSKEMIQASANSIINKCETFKRASFSNNSKLIICGAPWVDENYYDAIFKLKIKYDLMVFQILYDLIPVRNPEYIPKELCNSFSDALNQALSVVDHFIPISKFTGLDLEGYAKELGLKINKPIVLPLAIDQNQNQKYEKPKVMEGLKERKFILFVSTIEPRKNHSMLVSIWKELTLKYESDIPVLIFAGRKGWSIDDMYGQLENMNWLNGNIMHIENLIDDEIAWLYKNCEFTLFPSMTEGWGLPVGESISHGKICICSNAASMPEAANGVAIEIDPRDYAKWIQAISSLIESKTKKLEYEKKISSIKIPSWSNYFNSFLKKIDGVKHDVKSNQMFRALAPEFVYHIGLEKNNEYQKNIIYCGNPNLILDEYDWHPLEMSIVWAKKQMAKISIHNRSNENKISIALEWILPINNFHNTNFDFIVNGNKINNNYNLLGGLNHGWVILDDVDNQHKVIDISIELKSTKKINNEQGDHRNIQWGIRKLALFNPTTQSSTMHLLKLTNGISVK